VLLQVGVGIAIGVPVALAAAHLREDCYLA
jgi:hypothetical protein